MSGLILILSVFFFFANCFGESLIYRVERIRPSKDRPVFSNQRVEGEDCSALVFPFFFGRFVPDLQRAYDHAMEKAPPGTKSLADGEVYTKGFFLPPLFFIRCVTVTGSPSME
ncbi:hypothetical protein EHQ53_00080 [Leptospira langatensis]|uniref:Uncharacterized protein n=1 Tax=Leptospira langatensis TaxID=2484983 RepID=A0A5F1ZXZ4_9LEPT|nr:hypothetical protein EHO57_16225 [Leptospira langatensis]TGL43791.1 hypothetical protein EHQ53_00080 [Leptospira langatensis]